MIDHYINVVLCDGFLSCGAFGARVDTWWAGYRKLLSTRRVAKFTIQLGERGKVIHRHVRISIVVSMKVTLMSR